MFKKMTKLFIALSLCMVSAFSMNQPVQASEPIAPLAYVDGSEGADTCSASLSYGTKTYTTTSGTSKTFKVVASDDEVASVTIYVTVTNGYLIHEISGTKYCQASGKTVTAYVTRSGSTLPLKFVPYSSNVTAGYVINSMWGTY